MDRRQRARHALKDRPVLPGVAAKAGSDDLLLRQHSGRHLSAIGRGVTGATSEAIDLAVLQSFLEKLHDSTDDVRLLGSTIDLIAGGYCAFAKGPLHRILDALSNVAGNLELLDEPGCMTKPIQYT